MAYGNSVYPVGFYRLEKAEMGAFPIMFGAAGVLAENQLSLGTEMVLPFGNSRKVNSPVSLS